ncbi:hypothetical protein ACFYO9_10520 [Streptomyces sp. NPDC005863]|uniref:hypothetical protein n=1 Tax=unclassified Streptomyces TaxID=2593676 RepID=UPI0033D50C98
MTNTANGWLYEADIADGEGKGRRRVAADELGAPSRVGADAVISTRPRRCMAQLLPSRPSASSNLPAPQQRRLRAATP